MTIDLAKPMANKVNQKTRDGPRVAREGLQFCNRLFEVERTVRDATPDERLRARSAPILDEFGRWLTEQKSFLPCRKAWSEKPLPIASTTGFLYTPQDDRIEIDNNGVCVATVPKTGISSKPLLYIGFNGGRGSLMMRIQRVFLAKDARNTDQPRDMTVFLRESPLIPVFGSNDTQTPIMWDWTAWIAIKGGAWTSVGELLHPRFTGRRFLLHRSLDVGFRCVVESE